MQNFHPLFTHFPIGLLLLVPLLDLIGIIRRGEWYHRASLLVLFLGVLSAVAAVTTGLIAEDTVSLTPLTPRTRSWNCTRRSRSPLSVWLLRSFSGVSASGTG